MKYRIGGHSVNSRFFDRGMPRDLRRSVRTGPSRLATIIFLAVLAMPVLLTVGAIVSAIADGYKTGERLIATDRYEVTR